MESEKEKKREPQMTENGENEKAISAFILKISRKLRNRYLSGLAKRKVTCETIFFLSFAF